MAKRSTPYPLKFSVLGGIAFGLYFTFGLAYFETFPSGSILPYLLAGPILVTNCTILAVNHFSRKQSKSLVAGLLTGLAGLAFSGMVLWGIGGMTTKEGFSWDLLYSVYFHLLLVGLLPVVAVLVTVSPSSRNFSSEEVEAGKSGSVSGMEDRTQKSVFVFDAGSGEVVLRMNCEDLVMIEAADNYCKINYLQSGMKAVKLLRMPMKEAERVVQGEPGFFRCHRSFIVNAAMVEKVNGTSQSHRLKMRHLAEEVPVSRSFDVGVFRSLEQ